MDAAEVTPGTEIETARPRRRWLRRLLLGVVALVVVAAVGFFGFAPGIVESARNQVEAVELPDIDDETQALHDSLLIVDTHADTLMWKRNLLKRGNRGHVDLPRLQEGNVALQVFSSVSKSPRGQNFDTNTDETDNITLLTFAQLQPPRTWTSLLERSLYHGKKLERAVRDSGDAMMLIRTKGDVDDLVAARERGEKVIGVMYSVEGLQNLEGDIDNLEKLYDVGMRMAGFTHFFDNEVAGSMHGVEKGGLTDLGRQVLSEMEQRGIIVDLAHASHAAVEEILAQATRPLVSSHGGVQATCDVNRNLTDDEIRGVARLGGVIGIGYWPAAVCDATPEAVVDAIEHVIEVGGVKTAGLGSDYDGAVTVGWDTSQLAAITQVLRDRGYSDDHIAAIMGGNALRVLREVLPDAANQ